MPESAYRIRVALIAVFAALLFGATLAGACNDEGDGEADGNQTGAATSASTVASTLSGDIIVFAAASLTDSFEEIGTAFESANPDVSVDFNFAGSPALRTQLAEGAPADILAVADEANMATALEDGLVAGAGEIFASNRLVIIVPEDNPAGIETPFDLSNDDARLVLAAEEVPVGTYARQSIELVAQQPDAPAGYSDAVLANVVSNEPNVKAVVTKVQLGEADAGIVYVTDVTPDVEADIATVEIPEKVNVIALYPIAVTGDASSPDVATAFIEFVLSNDGQAVLRSYGFEAAP
jgi:molybdate transport system substrate-binding protein